MTHMINWQEVNKNMASITPLGKYSAYFFSNTHSLKASPDVFLKLIGYEGLNIPWDLHEFKLIPIYL